MLLALLLAGCGGDGGGTSDTGTTSDTPSASGTPADPLVTQLDLLTATAAGGTVTTKPTALPDPRAVQEYAAQFRNDQLGGKIVAAARKVEVPDGYQLAAAVVAVGCEVPTAVEGGFVRGGVRVRATLPPSDKKCLAPTTSVALMLVPDRISGEQPAGGR